MLFNSLHFCIYFPVVMFLYYAVPQTYAWLILLLASCYFYMSWQPYYILLIASATLVNYVASIYIEKSTNQRQKKIYLGASVISTFGLLFFFKYLNFFYSSAHSCMQMLGISSAFSPLHITLPVGISFFTFQTMSYTIDTFYGTQRAEKHIGKFALFVTYFPQLVAGPIERAGNLLGQLATRHPFTYENGIIGLRTLLGGMLLKIVVADNLAKYVDAVYNNVHDYVGWPLIFATYLFAFQIFCDFAGYSYMAIGIARMMGINLMENFRQPYMAQSVAEFWQRWHISLSTWFRDYVYIPLGGNRVSRSRYKFNLLVTFLLSGLWHGANWTFVIWGALHGMYMIIGATLPQPTVQKIPSILRMLVTFSAVCVAWIFFRANSLADAWYVIQHLFVDLDKWSTVLQLRRAVVMGRSFDITFLAAGTIAVWGTQMLQYHIGHIRTSFDSLWAPARIALYYAAVGALFLCGEFGGHQFIYFQF